MFGLGKHSPEGNYVALIDIGSGSVGVAIVASDYTEDKPVFVWSHRERMAITAEGSLNEELKKLKAAILNVFLELGNTGVRALKKYDAVGKITDIHVAVSAPWSYTATKTVTLEEKTPFEITHKLVDELLLKATDNTKVQLHEKMMSEKLGLDVISDELISLTVNGYMIKDPYGKETTTIKATKLSGVTYSDITNSIVKHQQEILPGAETHFTTFMYQYYQALQKFTPSTSEVCLIDITAKATEMGIVRDGILQYVTHIPTGTYSLASDIVGLCEIPKEEALGYMKDNGVNSVALLSAEVQAQINAVFVTYKEHLAVMFQTTGDSLTIPKTIFLHTDAETESFFGKLITEATSSNSATQHNVHPITGKLFPKVDVSDTALLLSAYVFHNVAVHS